MRPSGPNFTKNYSYTLLLQIGNRETRRLWVLLPAILGQTKVLSVWYSHLTWTQKMLAEERHHSEKRDEFAPQLALRYINVNKMREANCSPPLPMFSSLLFWLSTAAELFWFIWSLSQGEDLQSIPHQSATILFSVYLSQQNNWSVRNKFFLSRLSTVSTSECYI